MLPAAPESSTGTIGVGPDTATACNDDSLVHDPELEMILILLIADRYQPLTAISDDTEV
jgi:hypothetical protein